MSFDLKIERDRLLHLAATGDSPATRAALVDALHSKWEGIQITAARALANWGDESSLAEIKQVLLETASKDRRQSAIQELADCLSPHICENDMPWVLDLYLSQSKRTNRYSLLGLFRNLPPKQTILAMRRFAQTGNVDPRDEKDLIAAFNLAVFRSPRRL
jgi:hypothetical protein